jgi:hypothetical protein
VGLEQAMGNKTAPRITPNNFFCIISISLAKTLSLEQINAVSVPFLRLEQGFVRINLLWPV